MLLAVIILTVLLLISLAVAAPKVAKSIERQKEIETIHRGDQYRHAIKLYYQKFGHYPTSVKQLLNTNDIRFLRKQYKDPLTGKDDWKPVYYGQAHVHPLGFFGKPLSGIAGVAAAGVGAESAGMYALTPTTKDGTSSGDDGFGNSTDSAFGNSNGGDMFGGNQSGLGGNAGLAATGTSGLGATGTATSGAMGTGATGLTGSASPTGSAAGGMNSIFGNSDGDQSATTFGANGTGPIVGFTLPVKKPSIIDYMEQDAYNKWEFNYDPVADQMQQMVSLLGGAANVNNSINGATGDAFQNPGGATGTTGTSTGTTSGSSNGTNSNSGDLNNLTGSGPSTMPEPLPSPSAPQGTGNPQ